MAFLGLNNLKLEHGRVIKLIVQHESELWPKGLMAQEMNFETEADKLPLLALQMESLYKTLGFSASDF